MIACKKEKFKINLCLICSPSEIDLTVDNFIGHNRACRNYARPNFKGEPQEKQVLRWKTAGDKMDDEVSIGRVVQANDSATSASQFTRFICWGEALMLCS